MFLQNSKQLFTETWLAEFKEAITNFLLDSLHIINRIKTLLTSKIKA